MLHAVLLLKGTVSLALTVGLAAPPETNAAGYATPGVSASASASASPQASASASATPGVSASASEVVSPEVSAPPVTGAQTPPPGAEPVVPAPVVSPGALSQYPAPQVEAGPTPEHLRPPRPRGDGRGLLIAAGVMAALNVGLAAARLGLSLGESSAEREQARLILTAGVMPVNVAAGIGLAAAGGHYRGRIDGYRTAFERAPKLRATAFTGSGTVLLVMGAVAWASAWTPWHGDATLDGRGGGSLVVESVGSLLLMGGSGLVAYGVSWKRHTARYGRTVPVALRPAFAPGFAGLTLGGRF